MPTTIMLIFCSLLLSAICGFVFLPLIIRFCIRKGLYDIPNARKVHKNPIPRLGGISFIPSMVLATIAALILLDIEQDSSNVHISLWSLFFAISLLIIYFTGIIDDLIGLNATIKFFIEIVASLFLPLSGLYINNLYGFLGINFIPFWLGVPLTILVIVFICNAINLIDGIDGLSASLSFIALGGFLWRFYQCGLELYCMLIAALMGVLIPYLCYNMFGSPAKHHKIFMGDSGSLSLGFILGFLAVKSVMYNPDVVCFEQDSLVFTLSLLVVPTFDVVRVFFFRIMHHRSPFSPDKNHIHHKLMACGLSQHKALAIILILALIFIVVNNSLSSLLSTTWIVLIDVAIYVAVNIRINAVIGKRISVKNKRLA